jgi:transcriptional regulator with XRE-family HTH domain
MTLEVLAGLAGLSSAYLSMVENGKRSLNSYSRIMALADVLRVPPAELAPGLPDAAATPALRAEHLAALVTDGSDLAAVQGFRAADREVGGGHLYATVLRYLQTAVAPRLFGGGRCRL